MNARGMRHLLVIWCFHPASAFRSHLPTPRDPPATQWTKLLKTNLSSGCSQRFVVSFSSSDPVSGGSWFHRGWGDVELFTKSSSDEPGCTKYYNAQCKKNSVLVTEKCNGVVKETSERCVGGLGCTKAGWRMTSMKPGDKIVLRVPSTKGTCDFEMNAGKVNYYAVSSFAVLAPAADKLAIVAAKAAQMAGSTDECGEAAMKVRGNFEHAAETLMQLAEDACASADKEENSVTQALFSLWALLFAERRPLQNLTHLTATSRLHELANDIGAVQGFERSFAQNSVPLAVPTSIVSNPTASAGVQALAHYYNGLAQHPAQTSVHSSGRVLIFTCSFGGGHKSAATAMSDYLKAAGFETVVIDTTYDEGFYDQGGQLSAHLFNDFIIKRQNYALFNAMDSLNQMSGPLSKACPSPTCDSKRKHQFRTAVLEHRPDLVVTVYHMELLPVLEVAKELGNLPVLHIATDMDIKMKEIFKLQPIYPKLLVGIPFNLEESYQTIAPLVKTQTFLSGYPVRAAFLRPFDQASVAAEKAKLVPQGTKVMLIMTGGGGQDLPWPYKLARRGIGIPLHIVIIAGGNNELTKSLRAALPNNKTFPDGRVVWQGEDSSVTVEVATDPANTRADKPYFVLEDRLALLMDMADVMMSKPGGGSTAEIAYRGVPAIFDTSMSLFHWEMFTVDVFERASRGIRFGNSKALRDVIPKAIELGRSQEMAEESLGKIIVTSDRVVEAAKRLLTVKCAGCSIFAPA